MNPIKILARRTKRWAGYIRQWAADIKWHRRFEQPERRALVLRVVEQSRLLMTSGITAEDYYTHGLYRSDMSFSEKCSFLGFYHVARYFDTINPRRFDILARDKVLFHLIAKAYEIPVPKLVAVTAASSEPEFGRSITGLAALRSFLLEPASEEVFIKPAGSMYGEGALSLGKKSEMAVWNRLPGDELIGLDAVLSHFVNAGEIRRFLIEKRLIPHPLLAEIVPNVCCTLRVMTYVSDRPEILGVALRLGSGVSPTDNMMGDGFVAGVDLSTGQLGEVVSIASGVPERQLRHPVTGVQVSGKSLPYWQEVKSLVVSSASKLAFIPCIGWDIALTADGPVVVEINTHPRCRVVQVANGEGILKGSLLKALLQRDGTSCSGLNLSRHLSSLGPRATL